LVEEQDRALHHLAFAKTGHEDLCFTLGDPDGSKHDREWLAAGGARAEGFSGGGGSIYFGTGSPNSINAASRLAQDVGLDDDTGNYVAGLLGFYQADRYRLGGALQAHAWGGANFGKQGASDGAAGVAAAIMGLYGTYTLNHDRMLLNVGGIVGAGRSALGFSFGDGGPEEDENVATFLIEPHISLGVAACSWFGVEFQLSAPIFLLTEDLTLRHDGEVYTVKSSDMMGVNFVARLTFGRIAEL